MTGGRISALWQVAPSFSVMLAHTTQDQLANGTSAVSRLPLAVANARTPAERDAAWQNPQRTDAQQPCQPNCTFTGAGGTPYAVNDHSILSRYPEFADRKLRMDSVDFNWDMGFAALHSATSQFKDSRIGQADYASQGWAFYSPEGPILAGFDLGGSIRSDRSAYMIFDNTFSGLNHETRVVSKGPGPFTWIGGVYHTTQKRNFRFSEILPGMDAYINRVGGVGKSRASPLPDQGYSEDLGSKYTETALFAELGYRILPPWRVNVGARVFNYKDTANVDIVDWAGGAVNRQFTATGSASGKAYYKFNTSYQFSDNMLGYATASQGFRRGGTNPFRDRSTTLIVDPAVRDYQPDSTNNYELGLKGYLFDRQLYLETAVYRIDWINTQTYRAQDVSGFPVNGTTNGPDARSQGAEFSARWKITPAWQLSYSTATVQAKWADTKRQCLYLNNTTRECRTWTEGGLLGGAPKWRHNLGVRFNQTLANDVYVWASLTARYVGPVQVDRADSPADNATITKYVSSTRYNSSVGVSYGKWDGQLWVSNLTNLRVVGSVQAAGLMGPREISPQPRSVGMSLSYKFF